MRNLGNIKIRIPKIRAVIGERSEIVNIQKLSYKQGKNQYEINEKYV